MSNQLAEVNLDRVESEQGIELGRVQTDARKDTDYYPQFGASVRSDAAAMARHYEVFYALERSVRELVMATLEAEHGADWWTSTREEGSTKAVVPKDIRDAAQASRKREEESGFTRRSEDMIDYTTFGHLGEIIKTNWEVFSDTFNSRKAVEKVMNNLNLLRGPIAHCGMLAEDEVVRLQLSVRDWFRLME